MLKTVPDSILTTSLWFHRLFTGQKREGTGNKIEKRNSEITKRADQINSSAINEVLGQRSYFRKEFSIARKRI